MAHTLVMKPVARSPIEPGPSCLVDDAPGDVVEVVDGAIVLRPSAMKLNQYYLAQLDGQPYLYRRVSEKEVEVFGVP